jgi:hypothetical protein
MNRAFTEACDAIRGENQERDVLARASHFPRATVDHLLAVFAHITGPVRAALASVPRMGAPTHV